MLVHIQLIDIEAYEVVEHMDSGDRVQLCGRVLRQAFHKLRNVVVNWEINVPQVKKRRGTYHPISARARAHACFVAAIFCENNSSKALTMSFGGPPSMMSLSGKPWLSNREKLRGRDRLT